MAKYQKRKDGRYKTSVTVGIDYNTGKPIKIYVYGKSIAELEANKSLVMANYINGANIITKKITFGVYAEKWLKGKKPFISNKTHEMYESAIRLYTKNIKLKNIKDIAKYDVQNLINEQIDKPRTCKKIQVTLNQIFNSAYQDNLISRSPCKGIQLPKYQPNTKRALTILEDTLSDISEFTDRERAYILLIKYCGLRKEEALALTVDDFNLIDHTVTINKAVEFIKNKPQIKETKSKAGNRVIPLISQCFSFVSYYISNLTTTHLFNSIKTGTLITDQSFKKMWESIIKKMNKKSQELGYKDKIENLTSHVFRHNYASILYESGVSIKEAQYLLGHSSINITMDVYTHLDEKKLKSPKLLQEYINNKTIQSE